jgi:hypothetical protein
VWQALKRDTALNEGFDASTHIAQKECASSEELIAVKLSRVRCDERAPFKAVSRYRLPHALHDAQRPVNRPV